jgi:hypothetical protein
MNHGLSVLIVIELGVIALVMLLRFLLSRP